MLLTGVFAMVTFVKSFIATKEQVVLMSYFQSINYYIFHSVLFFSSLVFLKSIGSFFYKKRYLKSDQKVTQNCLFVMLLFSLNSVFYIEEINKLY